MAAAGILKIKKSGFLRNRLTDFDEILHNDADWPSGGYRLLHFSNFPNPRWRVLFNCLRGGGHLLRKRQLRSFRLPVFRVSLTVADIQKKIGK